MKGTLALGLADLDGNDISVTLLLKVLNSFIKFKQKSFLYKFFFSDNEWKKQTTSQPNKQHMPYAEQVSCLEE